MAGGKDQKKQTPPPNEDSGDFAIDHDSSGVCTMPSITLLLNRKKMTVTRVIPTPPAASVPQPPAFEPPPTASESDGITLNEVTSPSSLKIENSSQSQAITTRIQTAKPRAEQRGTQRVILWDIQQLKSGPDPLGRALAQLMDRGVKLSLFLALTPSPQGGPVPHFVASAAIAPRDRLKLWTGLRWDPKIVPALWNTFVRAGHAELPPPDTQTDIASNRNVVRAAFGVDGEDWLLLVRVGPPDRCRGVLALVSPRSMLQELSAVAPLIVSPLQIQSPKKAS